MKSIRILLLLGSVALCLGQTCAPSDFTDITGIEIKGSRVGVTILTQVTAFDTNGAALANASVRITSWRYDANTGAVDENSTMEIYRITDANGFASDTRGYNFGQSERIMFEAYVTGINAQCKDNQSIALGGHQAGDEIMNSMSIMCQPTELYPVR